MEITQELVNEIDKILERGLSKGIGVRGEQVCIEAAICEALDLPHGDDPNCVAASVRRFKINLNDKEWSSPEARAKGLRDLGIAQLGSLNVVNDMEFVKRLAKKTIQKLIPTLFREVFSSNAEILALADECELKGDEQSANTASAAAKAADASAAASAAAKAADASAAATYLNKNKDKYLILSAQLALEVLIELNSPGVKFLNLCPL